MSNLPLFRAVARSIQPLLDELVFTGGIVVEHYRTTPLVTSVRATRDADAICTASTYTEYSKLGDRLRGLGYTQPLEENTPPFRWRKDWLVLDVMPLNEDVLGFTNRWYGPGLDHTNPLDLGDGLVVRILDAPHFLATKLEAFAGRGSDDPIASPDLEDVVTLLATRPEIVVEVTASAAPLREWVSASLVSALPRATRSQSIAGHLPSTAPTDLAHLVSVRVAQLTSSDAL